MAALDLSYACLLTTKESPEIRLCASIQALHLGDLDGLGYAIDDAISYTGPSCTRMNVARLALLLRSLRRVGRNDFGLVIGKHKWDDAGNGADDYCVRCDVVASVFFANPPCTGHRYVALWENCNKATTT